MGDIGHDECDDEMRTNKNAPFKENAVRMLMQVV
jgi:hypothetical protein